jgi:hypothetical protein
LKKQTNNQVPLQCQLCPGFVIRLSSFRETEIILNYHYILSLCLILSGEAILLRGLVILTGEATNQMVANRYPLLNVCAVYSIQNNIPIINNF